MKIILTTSALLLAATGAMAQGFSGATVGIDYHEFSNFSDTNTTKFFGSAEFEIGNGFSVAADVSTRSFEGVSDDLTNIVVHGIYALSPETKLGVYVGRESDGAEDIDNYGIEIAYAAGLFNGEAYLGASDAPDGTDLRYFGLSGGARISGGFSVNAGYDSVTFDETLADITFSTLEFGGEFALSNGAALYAKAGNLKVETGGLSDDEDYFSLGATVSFGPQGGTTFGPRGLFEIIKASFAG
ncbi:hypothetical protein [Yoonia sp.]|uniref:hypothetical protein n=1 Tax=Yoonia sp. TaxID=2212373 RepID=UPI001A07C021|nr:hypothetical protein [Yoonia sp.]MBE0413847.1 hypothetical protein [Yoonia sp.]